MLKNFCFSSLVFALSLGTTSAIIAQESPGEIVIQDSLTDGKTAGTLVGGKLTEEGYVADSAQSADHILYQLPRTIRHGQITFEAKGVKPNPTNANHDPALLGMYDGTGITEPIAYFNDYKSNHFRFNVHVRSDKKLFKGVVNAAFPTENNLTSTKAVFPKDERDWSVEPDGRGNISFSDLGEWETFKLEWGPDQYRLSRDGQWVWKYTKKDGDPDYAPRDHRLWLGSAPNASDTKYTTGNPPFIFRNVEIRDLDPVPEPG
jgi:hypothetical protein